MASKWQWNVRLLPFLLAVTVVKVDAMSTSDFCRFDEELKQKFRNLQCGSNLDECATSARTLAQNNLSGSWGAVIVVNKKLVVEERVDWHLHTINPQPSRCRLLINGTVIMEVFRTGYRKLDVHQDQRQWIWREAKISRLADLDICPHSAIREVMASYSLKHNGMSEEHSKGRHVISVPRHNFKSLIYSTAKNLAQLFYAETGHHWNVFVTKDANRNDDELGFNFPHYVFDARGGFCIGQTADGYSVNAAVVGFADSHEEATSSG